MTHYANTNGAGRLFSKRLLAGYSVEGVARVLKVDVDSLHAWEQGVCHPNRQQYQAMADLYKCQPEWLFFDHLVPFATHGLPGQVEEGEEARRFDAWLDSQALLSVLARYQRRFFLLPKNHITAVVVQGNVYHHLGETSDAYRGTMKASETMSQADASAIAQRRPMDASLPGRLSLVTIPGCPLIISTSAMAQTITNGVPQVITKTYTQFARDDDGPALFWLAARQMLQIWDCGGLQLTGSQPKKRPRRVEGHENVYELDLSADES